MTSPFNKNTKTATVKGQYFTNGTPQRASVMIIYTDDSNGKTLSLVANDTMITVPFEEIEKLQGGQK